MSKSDERNWDVYIKVRLRAETCIDAVRGAGAVVQNRGIGPFVHSAVRGEKGEHPTAIVAGDEIAAAVVSEVAR